MTTPLSLAHTRPSLSAFFRDATPGAFLSGLIAILIGWAGPNVLIYAVAQNADLSDGAAMSWLWAHTVLCGLGSVYLSFRSRTPILLTWSTPGIAFLLTALPGTPFPQAVGAFLVSGMLVLLLGTFRSLTALIGRIPAHLAAALNAAILLPFAFKAVTALGTQPLLVGGMMLAFFGLRRLAPRWAVAGVLLVGMGLSAGLGLLHPAQVPFALTRPEFVMPEFTWQATVNLALPLTLLAFTGQFVPGFAVLKTAGYMPDPAPIIRTCGGLSLGAALLGCHNLTLGAMITNVVIGPDAHPQAEKRYTAGVFGGLINLLFGLFAGTFLHLMGLLPAEAIAALAGLALLNAMGSALQAALREAPGSLAAPVVLAVTLSGLSLLGIGAAFWGILAGLGVHLAERRRGEPVGKG